MCLPKPGRETSFDTDWFRYGKIVYSGQNPVFRINDENYDKDIMDLEAVSEDAPQFIPLEWMTKALLFDPIPGDPRKLRQDPECFHGLVVVGKDPWGRRFCLDSARYRCTPEEIFDKIMILMEKWYTRTLALEEVSFMYVFEPLFRLLAETRYQWCPDMLSVSPGGRHKDDRILSGLQTANETGFWYYNQASTTDVLQELAEFPHATSKDILDALSYTDEILVRPETPAEKIKSYHSLRSEDRGICGYGF